MWARDPLRDCRIWSLPRRPVVTGSLLSQKGQTTSNNRRLPSLGWHSQVQDTHKSNYLNIHPARKVISLIENMYIRFAGISRNSRFVAPFRHGSPEGQSLDRAGLSLVEGFDKRCPEPRLNQSGSRSRQGRSFCCRSASKQSAQNRQASPPGNRRDSRCPYIGRDPQWQSRPIAQLDRLFPRVRQRWIT